jgi:hypothetical protein
VHYLVTLVEGKGARRPSSWVTLQVLVCNGENFQRKYMEHTGSPGREIHPGAWSLGLKTITQVFFSPREGINEGQTWITVTKTTAGVFHVAMAAGDVQVGSK